MFSWAGFPIGRTWVQFHGIRQAFPKSYCACHRALRGKAICFLSVPNKSKGVFFFDLRRAGAARLPASGPSQEQGSLLKYPLNSEHALPIVLERRKKGILPSSVEKQRISKNESLDHNQALGEVIVLGGASLSKPSCVVVRDNPICVMVDCLRHHF